MKKIFILFGCLVILSCDKDDISLNDNLKLESYFATYMDYDVNASMPYIGPGGNLAEVQLEYSKNDVVKRKGGFLPSGGNFEDIFLNDIVDELTHSKNKIIIEKKSYNPLVTRLYNRLRTIDLSNDGIMMKKTILELGASGDFNDTDIVTIIYTYNSEKLLKNTHKEMRDASYSVYFPDINGIKYFEDASYYYTSNNLDSIITIRQNYNEQTGIYTPALKSVEIFSNYDNASNPTKNLFMFDETFKRSLSKNNYASYRNSVYAYSNDGVLNSIPSSLSGKSWTYTYDEEGNIMLGL